MTGVWGIGVLFASLMACFMPYFMVCLMIYFMSVALIQITASLEHSLPL